MGQNGQGKTNLLEGVFFLSTLKPLRASRLSELVRFGQAIRRLETAGLREVASTRVLIAAGRLVAEGLSLREAARAAIVEPLSDDATVTDGLLKMIEVYLPDRPG